MALRRREKTLRISLFVSPQYTNVTASDRRKDKYRTSPMAELARRQTGDKNVHYRRDLHVRLLAVARLE